MHTSNGPTSEPAPSIERYCLAEAEQRGLDQLRHRYTADLLDVMTAPRQRPLAPRLAALETWHQRPPEPGRPATVCGRPSAT